MTAADDLDAVMRIVGRPVSLVGVLAGGQHAATSVVSDGTREFVVRRFPLGDPAVSREIDVLPRLVALGGLAPALVGHGNTPDGPVIVTTRVPGTAPDPTIDPTELAPALAAALARIHDLDGAGLPAGPPGAPEGEPVLTHSDFWSGNALWQGDRLTGVVDWSGARSAPRGTDVAWCRLDLVLLGSRVAADTFLEAYQSHAGVRIESLEWDRWAAAHADPIVDSWDVNYAGIGRPDLTGAELRRRFDRWVDDLVRDAEPA